ncbi:ubiquitin-protein ligase E3B [Capsaspora owczarzaki ATCC 30864]|uniref:HECT-type E3 ubiquitin transferase n=1 Tax=Capsaspora owczarzaki (strain ATCC 30864) TaxID=595528 RepID=A0A0D2WK40_CAPO3|nr:ubiquitin-protein ligase E3B [Capsaspora owczarzaki ATCC 30864]
MFQLKPKTATAKDDFVERQRQERQARAQQRSAASATASDTAAVTPATSTPTAATQSASPLAAAGSRSPSLTTPTPTTTSSLTPQATTAQATWSMRSSAASVADTPRPDVPTTSTTTKKYVQPSVDMQIGSALVIQKWTRMFLVKRNLAQKERLTIDLQLAVLQQALAVQSHADSATNNPNVATLVAIPIAATLHAMVARLLFIYHPKHDYPRLVALCKLILASMDAPNNLPSFAALALQRDLTVVWIRQMKRLLVLCVYHVHQASLQLAASGLIATEADAPPAPSAVVPPTHPMSPAIPKAPSTPTPTGLLPSSLPSYFNATRVAAAALSTLPPASSPSSTGPPPQPPLSSNTAAGLPLTSLRMLATFTDASTWKLSQQSPEPLKQSLAKISSTFLQHLNQPQPQTASAKLTLDVAFSSSNFSCETIPVIRTTAVAFLSSFLQAASSPKRNPHIPSAALVISAAMTLFIRPIIASRFSRELVLSFVLEVLSIPALFPRLAAVWPAEGPALFEKLEFLQHVINALEDSQTLKIIFYTLEGNYTLCLIANLVSLFGMHLANARALVVDTPAAPASPSGSAKSAPARALTDRFVEVLHQLLVHDKSYVRKKQTSHANFHPLFGWFSGVTDATLSEAFPQITLQLQNLWKRDVLRAIFADLFKPAFDSPSPSSSSSSSSSIVSEGTPTAPGGTIKKQSLGSKLSAIAHGGSSSSIANTADSLLCMRVRDACQLYETLAGTLVKLKAEVLNALSYASDLLPRLWRFLSTVGPTGNLKVFLDSAVVPEKEPFISILVVFCDACSHLFLVLDDEEIYNMQKPFSMTDLANLSKFLNQFLFTMIWQSPLPRLEALLAAIDADTTARLLRSSHRLLTLLYERDARRPFTSGDHWLIPELKSSAFDSDWRGKGSRSRALLRYIPHCIPFRRRVDLFRKQIDATKGDRDDADARPSMLVRVRRNAVLDDGFRQLCNTNGDTMRGVIRVKFTNAQGLDEAGIDQDGVFKEFLEETIKQAFDPNLGLFRTTSSNLLYPSLTSRLQEDHVKLFEFVGRMLGKALYEGIVVEVPFAHFFLSKLLGRHNGFDELSSLDPDLYKNLAFIKRYDGDVEDLGLTFSVDEDLFGTVVTNDLKPGGRAVSVTTANRILYVHLMADFRMNTQLRVQSQAFIHGFRTVIPDSSLRIFSSSELQKLISGDSVDFDVSDLRRHTTYYGGYHDSHRTVQWLWECVAELDTKERCLFLKFVTSCSKPPILGFAHLHPTFSVRCVEDQEDEHVIIDESITGTLRGLFSGGRDTNRLPTASTCFNLLKLPNYKKKKTLKEKLRYAINAGAGFELS